jgi:hypothetical protein
MFVFRPQRTRQLRRIESLHQSELIHTCCSVQGSDKERHDITYVVKRTDRLATASVKIRLYKTALHSSKSDQIKPYDFYTADQTLDVSRDAGAANRARAEVGETGNMTVL